MRLMPMKFKSFVWPVNPTQLEIKENKVIQEIFVPLSKTKGKKTGKVNRQVTGRGYFTGVGSMKTFQELQKVFYQNGGGSLQLPNQLPVYGSHGKSRVCGQDRRKCGGVQLLFFGAKQTAQNTGKATHHKTRGRVVMGDCQSA